jgi:hypothetical protein
MDAMKRIELALDDSPSKGRLPAIVGWAVFGALAFALLTELQEGFALDRGLAEMRSTAGTSASARVAERPSLSDLARLEHLTGHAAVRLADWNGAFSELSRALPLGVTVERIALNARTGKGEATVRAARANDASRAAEAISSRAGAGALAISRCDQSGARDGALIRCELHLNWRPTRP